jgi:competence protein ComEA
MSGFFREHKKKVGILVLLLLSFVLYFFSGRAEEKEEYQEDVMTFPQEKEKESTETEDKNTSSETPDEVWVDVKGEVVKPGVYKANNGERVIHFIQLAGGFTEHADPKSVNLAAVAVDEMVIYASKKGEQPMPAIASPAGTGELADVISINTATKEQLMELPGVGPAKADAIISYRDENGPFATMEDLLEVKGIGKKTAEEWKEKITFTH